VVESCTGTPDAGKIERWHQTLKNRILLENYFLPGDLEAQIEAFVDHHNHQCFLGAGTPAKSMGAPCVASLSMLGQTPKYSS
jgi:hypothetical protein